MGLRITMNSTQTITKIGIVDQSEWIAPDPRKFAIWNTVGPVVVLDQDIPFAASTEVVNALTYKTFTLSTPVTLVSGQTYVVGSVLLYGDKVADGSQIASTVITNPAVTYVETVFSDGGSGFAFPANTYLPSPVMIPTNVNFWFLTSTHDTCLSITPGIGTVVVPDLDASAKFTQAGVLFPLDSSPAPTAGQLLTIQPDAKSALWQDITIPVPLLLGGVGSYLGPGYSFAAFPAEGLYFDTNSYSVSIPTRFTYGQAFFPSGLTSISPWGAFLRRKTANPTTFTCGATPKSMVSYTGTNYKGTDTIPSNLLKPGDIIKIHLDGTLGNSGAGVPNGIVFEVTVNGFQMAYSTETSVIDLSAVDNLAIWKLDVEITYGGTPGPIVTAFTTGFFNYRVLNFTSFNVGEWGIGTLTPLTGYDLSTNQTLDVTVRSSSDAGNNTIFSVTGCSMSVCTGGL